MKVVSGSSRSAVNKDFESTEYRAALRGRPFYLVELKFGPALEDDNYRTTFSMACTKKSKMLDQFRARALTFDRRLK